MRTSNLTLNPNHVYVMTELTIPTELQRLADKIKRYLLAGFWVKASFLGSHSRFHRFILYIRRGLLILTHVCIISSWQVGDWISNHCAVVEELESVKICPFRLVHIASTRAASFGRFNFILVPNECRADRVPFFFHHFHWNSKENVCK